MKKTVYLISIVSVLLTIVSILLYSILEIDLAYSLAITFGTITYHFLMRLVVGFIFDTFMKNQADYSKKWYQNKPWEKKLYKRLNVKRWKSRLPSFQPDYFNPEKHNWHEIAQAMCQAELVHEVIVVLSFTPIICSYWFGALVVFIITSLLAAIFDMVFVIMQRYNRPRIIRLIKK